MALQSDAHGQSAEPYKRYAESLNELRQVSEQCWATVVGQSVLSDDPKFVGVWLLARLRDHIRAFALLTNDGLVRDAQAVLRSAIEAALALASLRDTPAEFVARLHADAAWTLKGQIASWRLVDPELADDAESGDLGSLNPVASKRSDQLEFWALAKEAALPDLYHSHKHLSGTAVHVTGLAMVQDLPELTGDVEAIDIRRGTAITMMTTATWVGLHAFAQLHDLKALVTELDLIASRCNARTD